MTQEEKEFFTRLENKIDKLQLAVDQLRQDLVSQSKNVYGVRFATGPVVPRFNGDRADFSRTNNNSHIEPPKTSPDEGILHE